MRAGINRRPYETTSIERVAAGFIPAPTGCSKIEIGQTRLYGSGVGVLRRRIEAGYSVYYKKE
jgi:hypothetical protein